MMAPPQLLGTSELNKTTTAGRRDDPSFAPGGMRDSMLAVHGATHMVDSFQNGVRHAGWLYKLVGKSPQDINWKRYWVSAVLVSRVAE